MAWDRTINQRKGGTPFQVPNNLNPQQRGLAQQRMNASVGGALDQVKIGDHVTGEFFTGDGQQGRRSTFFDRATNGVLANNGKGGFDAKRVGPTTWQRSDGVKIQFDPKAALRGLGGQAVRQTVGAVGGPYGKALQGLMTLDNLIAGITGKGGMERWNDLVKATQDIRPVKPTSGLMKF
ncbi:hypothetical protein [Synechococcus sp. PROS-9-1]|uniref:hypothetical protein n=1 Tax=Synechococcus sp. PROS-9-1 TaxID=1968775 RepID=UPI0016480DC2|nr:hypothetical protein [Synechococcus sp. PROS-9-1]